MADYEYWQSALADPAALNRREFSVTPEPCCGFYRTRDGKPVAIWPDEESGALVVLIGDDEIQPEAHEEAWLGCAKRPVPEEWYHIVLAGQPWPDLDEFLASMGDNVRQGMDEVEQIDELAKQAAKYSSIDDDEKAARAQSLRARLLELKKRVDDKRESLKAPHLKEARAIDEIWMPPVKKAEKFAKTLKALVENWETTKRRLAREAEAKRLAAEAEQRRLEAEERGRRIDEHIEAIDSHTHPDMFPPLRTPAPPPPKTQIRAGYGRAASVRERMVVVGIEDLGRALDTFGDSPEVEAALIQCAQKLVDSGELVNPPGFLVELRALVR